MILIKYRAVILGVLTALSHNFNYLLASPYVLFRGVIQSSGFEWLLSTLFDASLLELEPQATVAHFLCGVPTTRSVFQRLPHDM